MDRTLGPCAQYWFGTDQMGRDIFSRVLFGARYSLLIGLGSVIFSAVFGVLVGAVAGYFGGWLDNLIMRLCDVIQSIPGMILNITLACVLGPGVGNTILALGVEGIAGTARLMRSSILNVRKMEYLDAASTSNCSNARIIVRHVFPNTFAPILVQATMGVGGRIMMAASMSYIHPAQDESDRAQGGDHFPHRPQARLPVCRPLPLRIRGVPESPEAGAGGAQPLCLLLQGAGNQQPLIQEG